MKIMRIHRLLVLAVLCPMLPACATRSVVLGPGCGSGPNSSICMGPMKVPQKYAGKFTEAARIAIDVVHSDTFAFEVTRYMEKTLRDNAEYRTSDWNSLNPEGVVRGVRKTMPNLPVAVYGGPWAWLKYQFSDNVAQDNGKGPIGINEWALSDWDSVDVANSMTHETSHRAGMTHKDGERECGPPYVLGTIVARLARGASWKWLASDDCPSFKPSSGSVAHGSSNAAEPQSAATVASPGAR
jgi:hypothetical protein